LLTLRAVGDGTLANFMHTGILHSAIVSATNLDNIFPTTAPAVGTGFDASTSAALDLQATWSAASASNSIQLHQYLLESVV
jgi:3-oxoacyl-[acyl-carrier-protein] synthase III